MAKQAGVAYVSAGGWVSWSYPMRALAASIMSLSLIMTAQAQQLNQPPGRYEYVPQNAYPQYNPHIGRYEAAAPNSVPQYNTYTNKYELAPPNAAPQYNPYTQRWQLMGPDQGR